MQGLAKRSQSMPIALPLPSIMRAVVLKDKMTVIVEDRPTPRLTESHEIIIKVAASGLCGEMKSIA
jgi:hypothetical protein